MEKDYNINKGDTLPNPMKQKGKGFINKLGKGLATGILGIAISSGGYTKSGDIQNISFVPKAGFSPSRLEVKYEGERFATDYKNLPLQFVITNEKVGKHLQEKGLAKKVNKNYIILKENYSKVFNDNKHYLLNNLKQKSLQNLLNKATSPSGEGGAGGAGAGAGGGAAGGGTGGSGGGTGI